MDRLVCGNSNMRNLTTEDRKNNRSHHCTEDDPCDCCLTHWGRIKLIEMIRSRSTRTTEDKK
jgi:hypothetical protein